MTIEEALERIYDCAANHSAEFYPHMADLEAYQVVEDAISKAKERENNKRMTNFEKHLLERGMAEMARYPAGTVVYGFKDEDGFYGYEKVAVYPDKRGYEIHVGPPYLITLSGNAPKKGDEREFVDKELLLFREHLERMIALRDELDAIENPWEERKLP